MSVTFAADVAIKTTIFLSIAGALVLIFRRSGAATRHAIWAAGMLGFIVLPLLAWVLPTLEWKVLPGSTVPVPPSVNSIRPPDQSPASRTMPAVSLPLTQPVRSSVWTWNDVLVVGWFAGALVVALRILFGLLSARRLLKFSLPAGTTQNFLLLDLQKSLSISGNVRLRISDRSITPMTLGVRRRAILLPAAASDWTEERLRFVLAHELAHVKRWDVLLQIPLRTVCCVYWFNPLVWIANRRLMIERERACDDVVLNAGGRAEAYAQHLLDIARSVRHRPGFAFAGISMASRSQLETRLLSILDSHMNRRIPHTRTFAVLIVAAVVVLAPLAALKVRAQETQPSASPATQKQRPETPADKPSGNTAGQSRSSAPANRAFEEWENAQEAYGKTYQRENDFISEAGRAYEEAMRSYHENFNNSELARQAAEAARDLEEQHKLLAEDSQSLLDHTRQLMEDSSYFHELVTESGRISQEHLDIAVGPLFEALKDSNAEVRSAAAGALGQLRDRRAVTPLIEALRDEDADVRSHAATALGSIRDTTAAQALIDSLKDPNPSVRREAVVALGELRVSSAIGPILEAMKDSDPDVRQAAVRVLPEVIRRR